MVNDHPYTPIKSVIPGLGSFLAGIKSSVMLIPQNNKNFIV